MLCKDKEGYIRGSGYGGDGGDGYQKVKMTLYWCLEQAVDVVGKISRYDCDYSTLANQLIVIVVLCIIATILYPTVVQSAIVLP